MTDLLVTFLVSLGVLLLCSGMGWLLGWVLDWWQR